MYHLLAQQNNPQRPVIVIALNKARETLANAWVPYEIDNVLPIVLEQVSSADKERNDTLDLHQRMRFLGDI